MGKRNTGRKLAMQALYQAETRQVEVSTILESFLSESSQVEDTQNWARNLVTQSSQFQRDADELISKYAIDWDISRINLVDKSILRVAFYELLNTDTPVNIVINEAIEIAREFSTDESPKFINGINY